MIPAIENNTNAIKNICSKNNVSKLFLFGSAARGIMKDKSDLDFLVSFKEMDYMRYTDCYFNLHEGLESILKSPIDLLTDKSLSNPYFISSIEESKMLIYES
jgi:predicted nucleotidyltransferase